MRFSFYDLHFKNICKTILDTLPHFQLLIFVFQNSLHPLSLNILNSHYRSLKVWMKDNFCYIQHTAISPSPQLFPLKVGSLSILNLRQGCAPTNNFALLFSLFSIAFCCLLFVFCFSNPQSEVLPLNLPNLQNLYFKIYNLQI